MKGIPLCGRPPPGHNPEFFIYSSRLGWPWHPLCSPMGAGALFPAASTKSSLPLSHPCMPIAEGINHLPQWLVTQKTEEWEGLAELLNHRCFQNMLWLMSLKLMAAKHMPKTRRQAPPTSRNTWPLHRPVLKAPLSLSSQRPELS